MGQNTTAFNIDELITSYIDNEISDPALKKQVEEMLTSDARLNNKYRAELLTKSLLQQRLKRVDVQQHTYYKIISLVDSVSQTGLQRSVPEYSASEYRKNFWVSFGETLTTPLRFGSVPVPRYAFVIVFFVLAAGSFYMFNSGGSNIRNPHILAGTEKSILVQAVNEFHRILDGDCKMEYNSNNEIDVAKYVKDKANFQAFVPRIENYNISGCMLNDYNGRKLAHLVYVSGDDIIYIYQTTMDAVAKNELDLPQEIRDEIVKAKYYMCDGVDDNNCTMTLWFKDNIVCASMTTMPKQETVNTFTSFIR